MPLLSTVKNEITNVIEKMLESKSDIIVLHIGHKDLWIGNKAVDIIEDFKQIINKLLDHTEAKVSVSLIIPGDRQYPRLDEEVSRVNIALSEHISNLRKDKNLRDRLFTANNNRIREFVSKNVGPRGTQLILSDRGKNLLWLRLRDCIARCLKPYPTENKSASGNQATGGRESYRRKVDATNSNQRNSDRNEYRRR